MKTPAGNVVRKSVNESDLPERHITARGFSQRYVYPAPGVHVHTLLSNVYSQAVAAHAYLEQYKAASLKHADCGACSWKSEVHLGAA